MQVHGWQHMSVPHAAYIAASMQKPCHGGRMVGGLGAGFAAVSQCATPGQIRAGGTADPGGKLAFSTSPGAFASLPNR